MDNVHTRYDLAQMQSISLESKIRMTQQRIEQWYDAWDGKVYVSRSGGKDSDVLGDIVKKMYPDVPHVFCDGMPVYDNVRNHGISESNIVVNSNMSFTESLIRYGYPIISKEVALKISRIQRNKNSAYVRFFDGSQKGKSRYDHSGYAWLLDAPFKISADCCVNIKEAPLKLYAKRENRKPFIGTMASESYTRKTKWEKYGCNAFELNEPQSNPISFWTDQDILLYILTRRVEIAESYGDIVYIDRDGLEYENSLFDNAMKLKTTGENRTGCIFCMFGITQDKERFLRLKKIEPKKYDYVMRGGKFEESGMWIPYQGLGYKFVIDWLNEHGNLGIKY